MASKHTIYRFEIRVLDQLCDCNTNEQVIEVLDYAAKLLSGESEQITFVGMNVDAVGLMFETSNADLAKRFGDGRTEQCAARTKKSPCAVMWQGPEWRLDRAYCGLDEGRKIRRDLKRLETRTTPVSE